MDQTACPVIDKDEHLALLKLALEASLVARTEHDIREEQRAAKRPLKLAPWNIYGETPAEKTRLEELARDPVRCALRKQVRDLGKELYRVLGNTDAMLAVAEELAAKDHRRLVCMSARLIFIVTLQPKPGVEPYRALRGALKVLGRRFGLRAISVKEKRKRRR